MTDSRNGAVNVWDELGTYVEESPQGMLGTCQKNIDVSLKRPHCWKQRWFKHQNKYKHYINKWIHKWREDKSFLAVERHVL